MAEKVPVDECGMPFLLHPYEPPNGYKTNWDDDHSFFFSSLPELNDQAGAALRYSRVQRVPRWLHERKHDVHYPGGVEHLPSNDQDKFGLTVLACAGYTSPFALDVRGSSPKLVRMSQDTYEFVKGRRQLHVETRRDEVLHYRTQRYAKRKIGLFFAEYVKQQDISSLDESTIDEFLHARNQEVRRRLGNVILGHAMEVAVSPIKPTYREAMNAGLVRPSVRHPMKVIVDLFPKDKWPDYHKSLESKFAT